jgi:two-component system response regulator ChvI
MADPAATRARVVLVDDDPAFLDLLASAVQSAGHEVVRFGDPRTALANLREGMRTDLCILDWTMPTMNGLELLKQIRAGGLTMPVLFLTSHGAPIFEEAALTAGATDFVDKSRGPAIILHRVALALTRAAAPAAASAEPVADLRAGDLVLSRQSKRATWRGHAVALSQTEFDVVLLLVENAGQDVGYRQIYDLMRGDGFLAGQGEHGYRANVRAIIKRIRRKFTDADPGFEALMNYPGFGYRWGRDG